MNENLEKLIALLPPPKSPRHNIGNWNEVESALNTRLPGDFKEFTSIYGSVKICNWLFFHTPFPFNKDYPTFLRSLCNQFDEVLGGRENVPFPNFPSPGGLLPIGATDNADVISWITEGDNPDAWGVFFWAFPGIDTFTFRERNLTGVLLDIVNLTSPLFPTAMPVDFFSVENRRVDVTGSIE